jgi:hypothetical protein
MPPLKRALRRLAVALAQRTPGLRGVVAELQTARRVFAIPPGHFYSPIPEPEDMRRDAGRLFEQWPRDLPGVSLNEDKQLALLSDLSAYYAELPFSEHKTKDRRYFFENPMYSYSDAICLYAMIRHVRPRRIIEVGSGYSSCVTLDTNELFFGNEIACTTLSEGRGWEHLVAANRLMADVRSGRMRTGRDESVEALGKRVRPVLATEKESRLHMR